MTDIAHTHDHEREDSIDKKDEKQIKLFLLSVISLGVASTAIFGYAGLITFYVTAAVAMLLTIIYIAVQG